ncbi:MAG: hypothetical protein QXR76_03380 [Candidatus Bathyarchaeia archaeon]
MSQKVEFPESKAVKVWRKGDLTFSIVKHSTMGHYCGYVRFPKRPVREEGYEGILAYVPVHGGITYARQSEDDSMVYGFDCAHSEDWSETHPYGHKWTLEEVEKEAENMAIAIQVAAKYERRYLRNYTNKGKAKVIDEYHRKLKEKHGITFNLHDNFLAMLNVLGGKL